MACNTTILDANVEEKGNEDESDIGGDQAAEAEQVEKIKHHFSEPWEDSDVILVVEDEKFHVHRLILSMNSPVFKAMFKSQFKEATANEIPLPKKKANGVLDFLKIIYGVRYVKEHVEITMENVEQLLMLSDEYHVKELIFNPCVEFLEVQPKTKENVMKILALADLYNLDKVWQGCNDLLKNMKLETLSETVHLQDLDKEKMHYYLTQRIELLETILDELYPQFFGLLACSIWLFHETKKNVNWCTHHFSGGKVNSGLDISSSVIRECSSCCKMLESMVRLTSYHEYLTPVGMCVFGSRQLAMNRIKEFSYGGDNHFDDKLPSVMKDFFNYKSG